MELEERSMLDACQIQSPSANDLFREDVRAGLSARRKTLPCRWLYDSRGSELFEDITRLPEYYPGRVETALLRENASAIAAFADGAEAMLEYGAGSGIKTQLLIAALESLKCYVPIDIAGEFLARTASRMNTHFPNLETWPITSDFLAEFEIPSFLRQHKRIAFFPGSTIGNLGPAEATAFLKQMRRHVGPAGTAILGADLKKDTKTLLAAYDDAQGVTGAFNLNLLVRMNRELQADFMPRYFEHEARWNARESAVEMHLVSLRDQVVTIAAERFTFMAGESIHTESSRKYDVMELHALALQSGWDVDKVWTDAHCQFAVLGLKVGETGREDLPQCLEQDGRVHNSISV